jgi:predicted ATPase
MSRPAGAPRRAGTQRRGEGAHSLSQLRLPPTVQGILAARIDRLSAEQKDLLQTLAVIGRESPRALINKMTAMPDGQLLTFA